MPTSPKAVAHKNALKIRLAESVVFLRAGDATGRQRTIQPDAAPGMVRGLLVLTLAKPTRISSIEVELVGSTTTAWPEGASLSLSVLSARAPHPCAQASVRAESISRRNTISIPKPTSSSAPVRRPDQVADGTCPWVRVLSSTTKTMTTTRSTRVSRTTRAAQKNGAAARPRAMQGQPDLSGDT